MKFIRDLIARKKDDDADEARFVDEASATETLEETLDALVPIEQLVGKNSREDAAPAIDDIMGELDMDLDNALEDTAAGDDQLLESIVSNIDETEAQQPVNIWDMEEEDAPSNASEIAQPKAEEKVEVKAKEEVAVADPQPERSPARRRRNKTRLIGFEQSTGDIVDLFDPSAAVAPVERAKFPVGWIIVIDGPGRGECFTLFSGMSQIGRGEDQAVQLDFGDNAISRTNHAAIVYDPETTSFLVGHGGKSNIVRLNNKPLISNEELAQGDLLRIGETTLRFVALCGEDFSWTDGNSDKEDEDVAIA